jgi:hypothetical protein
MGCAVRLCLLVAAIVLPARPAEPQELFVTGFVETGLHYRSDVADEPARPLMPAAFGGRISIYGDLFEFAVEASCTLETPVSQLVPVPATMRATLFPLSWADLSVGRFAYLPGNAIMLSPVNFACPVDLEMLLAGQIDQLTQPSDLLQATLYSGPAYVKLLVLTRVPPASLPSTDSAWFPRASAPFPTGTIDLELEDDTDPWYAEPLSSDWDRLAYGAEAGVTAGSVDLTAVAYYGWDTRPLIRVDGGYYESTGIAAGTLSVVRDKMWGFGFSCVAELDALRLWSETAFSPSRSSLSSVIEINPLIGPPMPFRTTIVRSPWSAYVAGLSYRFSRPDLTATIEYGGDHYQDTTAMPYLLANRVLGRLDWSGLNQTLMLSLASLVDIDGPSAAFMISVYYQSFESVEARAGIGFFIGGADTSLGQFAENHVIAGAIRVWF